MLVLSRHRNEEIVIGDDGPNQVRIKIVDIRGDKVRVGIEAAREVSVHRREVPVHRREVYDAIQRNRLATAAQEDEAPAAAPVEVSS